MFEKCPKCGHDRLPDEASEPGICPACGLVFAKWVSRALGTDRSAIRASAQGANDDASSTLLDKLIYVEPRTDPIHFWGRVATWVLFFVWGWYFITLEFRGNEIGASFMHRVNLVFHEAGHVVFMPFGRFMMILGGTLGQLLMPIVVGMALVLRNRDNFGGSIGLWWLGQSLMDCAPYIADARALQLMLLGGGTGQDRPGMHDWENILLDLNLIHHDVRIAALVDAVGSVVMLVAFAWGACVLIRQYRNLEMWTQK